MKAKDFITKMNDEVLKLKDGEDSERKMAAMIVQQYAGEVAERIKVRRVQTRSGLISIKRELYQWLLAVKRIGKLYWFRPEGVEEVIDKKIDEKKSVKAEPPKNKPKEVQGENKSFQSDSH